MWQHVHSVCTRMRNFAFSYCTRNLHWFISKANTNWDNVTAALGNSITVVYYCMLVGNIITDHPCSSQVGYQPIALRCYFWNYSSPGVTPSAIHKSYHFNTCKNHYHCSSSWNVVQTHKNTTFLNYTHGVPQHRPCSSRDSGWARLSSSLQSVKIFGLSRAWKFRHNRTNQFLSFAQLSSAPV